MCNNFSRNIFICASIAAFIFIINTESSFAAKRTERYQQLIEMGAKEGKVAAEGSREKIERPVVKYQAEELRDPFKEYVSESEKSKISKKASPEEASVFISTLKIQGIICGGKFPQAIINDKIVKVGDMIAEARVVEINKEGVSLFLDNRIHKISSPAAGQRQPLKPHSKEKKGGNK